MISQCHEPRPVVLIVDDEIPVQQTVEALLMKQGYELRFASNANQALAKIQESLPDTILLDVMMPDTDGFELCRTIKSNPELRHIPIVLLTGLDGPEYLVRGLEAGADEFLTKPVTGAELKARVRSMLRIKKHYDQLADTLRLRDDLAHMIVHDMRNPIMAILTFAELLEMDTAGTPELNELVVGIRDAANRLNAFSNDILVTSKAEHERFLLTKEPVDLVALAREAVARHQALAAARHIELAFEAIEKVCTLPLDRQVFDRVLDNLLSNAIKFSQPDGSVRIALHSGQNGHAACIRVTDEGCGIAPENRERIFDKYAIANTGLTNMSQVGLGLYFCRLAVEAHGGTIAVEPNPPRGSVFTVKL